MHPQLAALRQQFDDATARAARMVAPLDDTTFHSAPLRGGWSPAECLGHLTLTADAMLPRIDEALARGQAGLPDTHRYRRGVIGALLAWYMEPPVHLRTSTLPAFVPDGAGPKEAILGRFERAQGEIKQRLSRASGLNLDDLRLVSPFNARIAYSPYAAFCIMAAHERRHLWQAEQVLAPSR